MCIRDRILHPYLPGSCAAILEGVKQEVVYERELRFFFPWRLPHKYCKTSAISHHLLLTPRCRHLLAGNRSWWAGLEVLAASPARGGATLLRAGLHLVMAAALRALAARMSLRPWLASFVSKTDAPAASPAQDLAVGDTPRSGAQCQPDPSGVCCRADPGLKPPRPCLAAVSYTHLVYTILKMFYNKIFDSQVLYFFQLINHNNNVQIRTTTGLTLSCW